MSSNSDFSKLPDLYKALGVSPSTPGGEFDREVKKNYRRLARENHPDRLKDLPEAERKERTEKMYLVNAAHEVLKNPEKRALYDQWRKEIREGEIRSRTAVSFEEMLDVLFKDIMRGSVFGEGGRQTLFGDWGFGWSLQRESYDYLLMPENDWGLLSALITAYQTEGDGKWKVKRAEADQRKWMPESVYVIKKKEGRVSVFRKITDWRSKYDRGQPIKTYKKEEPWEIIKEIDPSRYLGEYYTLGGW